MGEVYLQPNFEAGKELFNRNIQGEIFNLNLIKLKKVADYSQSPELDPGKEISGSEAYMLYVKQALPFVKASGGDIIFIGEGGRYLIGPENERWDICMLIKQKSVTDFFAFEQNEAYMKIVGHRTAAIEDSRLLPLTSWNVEQV